jgi:hypothetical protein
LKPECEADALARELVDARRRPHADLDGEITPPTILPKDEHDVRPLGHFSLPSHVAVRTRPPVPTAANRSERPIQGNLLIEPPARPAPFISDDRADIVKLDPADLLTSAQAGKLLAPLIKPLPAFDNAIYRASEPALAR